MAWASIKERGTIIFGIVAALFWLAALARWPVIADEAYYWTWAQAPGWSYYDHPPGFAWLLSLWQRLAGTGKFALRSLSALLVIATATISISAVRLWLGKLSKPWTLALLTAAPMFSIGYLPATPDILQGLWAAGLSLGTIQCLKKDSSRRWLIFLGIVAPLGMLVKQSSACILLGLGFYLLSYPQGRITLLRYGRSGWWLLPSALVLYWMQVDLDHAGAMSFQAQRVFSGGLSRPLLALPLTILVCAATLGPLSAFYLCWAGFKERDSQARALFHGALALLSACLLAVALGTGEANWPMPAFIFALPAIVRYLNQLGAHQQKWAWRGLMAACVLNGMALAHLSWPVMPALPPKNDPALRGAGFSELSQRIEALAQKSQAKAVLTRRYQYASWLRFHLQDSLEVVEMGIDRASQFDRWPQAKLCPGDRLLLVLPASESYRDWSLQELTTFKKEFFWRRRAGRYLEKVSLTVVQLNQAPEQSSFCPKESK